ncbi:MAG: anthranilate/aminodeoxychorismate synthase component II [Ignavibacteria bacterium GWA2_55_25]|nr:MAG: anthranilate/aminodeoxychorismate synthase component II [Ignavibacteria bacterium GWA2_55_25]
MILVIDNYDSFTYNLVQYLGELGATLTVVRNDQISVEDVRRMKPEKIVISPGPCTPKEAGVSVELIKSLHRETPILGVCLGHQAIGEAFGGKVIKAPSIVHGKTSAIHHTGEGIFNGLPMPFTATRYHSLVVEKDTLPSELHVTAWTNDGVIMGVQHKTSKTYGVQFHPESIATQHGKELLKNFLSL